MRPYTASWRDTGCWWGELWTAGLTQGASPGPGLRAANRSPWETEATHSPENTGKQLLAGSFTLSQEPSCATPEWGWGSSFVRLHGEGRLCDAYECSPSLGQPGFKSQHCHLPAVNPGQRLPLRLSVHPAEKGQDNSAYFIG